MSMSPEFSRPTVTLGMRLSFQDEDLKAACLSARWVSEGANTHSSTHCPVLPRRLAPGRQESQALPLSGCGTAAEAATVPIPVPPPRRSLSADRTFVVSALTVSSALSICHLATRRAEPAGWPRDRR